MAAEPMRRRHLWLLPLLAPARPAAAHSELRRSVPAAGAVLDQPPDRIELHFNERVQLTALRLRRVGGDEIPLPRRSIREATSETIALPPLAPGEYRAEWRIISADGHPAGGVIAFRIEPPRRP
jgi:methionine-rich copper-binding protein CopC